MSNEDLSRSVRRAIETLPVGAGARERGDIKLVESQLLTIAISVSLVFAGRIRALESATPVAAAAELRALARARRQLGKALSGLSREAHLAVDATRKELTGSQIPSTALIALFFRESYPRLAEAAELAAEELERDSLGQDQHRGRRRDERARGLARDAALTYWRVTGRRPTRRTDVADGRDYGPFLDFLGEIFRLAGVKASTSHYARLAIGDLNETNGANRPTPGEFPPLDSHIGSWDSLRLANNDGEDMTDARSGTERSADGQSGPRAPEARGPAKRR